MTILNPYLLQTLLLHTVYCATVRLDLKRIEYGNISIGDLAMGSWRYVKEEEVDYCKSIIKNWDDNGAGWNKNN